MTESADKTWIDEEPNTVALYAEIMAEVVKNSRATALQSELIWILKLSGLIRLVNNINYRYNIFYYRDTLVIVLMVGGGFFSSEFFDLTTDLYAMERKFKNVVLATYHEESVTSLDEASGAFRLDTEAVRKRLKTARQEFHYKLKPSHGHPRNTSRLESLMADFQKFNAECADTLSGTCDRMEVSGPLFRRLAHR